VLLPLHEAQWIETADQAFDQEVHDQTVLKDKVVLEGKILAALAIEVKQKLNQNLIKKLSTFVV
jgi:hypothetical protein